MTQAAILAASGSPGTTTGFKNRVINGNMTIDQRYAGASVTPIANAYTLDRWRSALTQPSKYTVQQNAGSVTPPAGFTNYLGITSSSAYSLGATDFFYQMQRIEGYNLADFAWGTANAKTIAVSFWVRSSLTGTFGGAIQNDDGNRSYTFTYTISSANTWEYKTVTIAGCTDGAWVVNNGNGFGLYFGLGVGTTYSTAAGSWTVGNYFGATGATSVVGTSGATFYITGCQLEVGTTATNFDFRSYGTELQLCQRYFIPIPYNNSTNGYYRFGLGITDTANRGEAFLMFPQPMRAAPSITAVNQTGMSILYNGSAYAVNSTTVQAELSPTGARVLVYTNSGVPSGATTGISQTLNANAAFQFSAEL